MRQGRPEGVHTGPACVKSHTARCVRKKAAAHFAGAWGVPNKQNENAAGGQVVDWNIRKGYSNPLLAAVIPKLNQMELTLPQMFRECGLFYG